MVLDAKDPSPQARPEEIVLPQSNGGAIKNLRGAGGAVRTDAGEPSVNGDSNRQFAGGTAMAI
jgi:hypothetical protein